MILIPKPEKFYPQITPTERFGRVFGWVLSSGAVAAMIICPVLIILPLTG